MPDGKYVYVVVGETSYENYSVLAVYDDEKKANVYVDKLIDYASSHKFFDRWVEDELRIIKLALNDGTLDGFVKKDFEHTYAGKLVRSEMISGLQMEW